MILYLFIKSIRNKDANNKLFNGTWQRGLIVLLPLIFLMSLIIICIAFSIEIYKQEGDFRAIVRFFLLFSTFLSTGIWTLHKKKPNENNSQSKKDNSWNDINIGIIYMLVFILMGTYQYSTNLYPHLPKNYGGGRPESVEISSLDNKHLKGEIIHSNSNLIFLNVKNKIKVIEWNKVQSIEINVKNR
ncbi:hypothetical protein [Paenisporosarcina sp.]|uniref:hypothetical protein n=1 Tax=Paenisporosarcina sp. TaxID=1932001 RepID=UPI003C795A1E